jgi:hypothetical protein
MLAIKTCTILTRIDILGAIEKKCYIKHLLCYKSSAHIWKETVVILNKKFRAMNKIPIKISLD